MDKATRSGDTPLAAKLFLQRADLSKVNLLTLEAPLREFSLDDPRAYARFLETLFNHKDLGPAVGHLRYDPYSEKQSTEYIKLFLKLTYGNNDALPFEKIKHALNAADIATCRMLLEQLGPSAGENAELLNLSNIAIKRIVESDSTAAGELLSRRDRNLFAPAVLQALAAAGEMEQVVASPAWRQLSATQRQQVYLEAISSAKMTEENRRELARSVLQEVGSSGAARAVIKTFLEHSRDPVAALITAETAPQYRDELVTEIIRQWAPLDVVAASEALAGRSAEERPDEAVVALIEEIHADPEAALAWATIIKDTEVRARQEAAVLKAWVKKDRPAATAAAARWNLPPPH